MTARYERADFEGSTAITLARHAAPKGIHAHVHATNEVSTTETIGACPWWAENLGI